MLPPKSFPALLAIALFLSACGGSNNNTATSPPTTVTPPPVTNPDPVFTPSANQAAVYYYRADGNYDGWVLHLWNSETCEAYAGVDTVWPDGPAPAGTDPNYGAYWTLTLKDGYGDCANFIIHKGDEKDPDSNDQTLNLASGSKRWTFALSGTGLFSEPTTTAAIPPTILGASAHWVDEETILWNPVGASEQADVRLHFSADASLTDLDALVANPATNQIKLSLVAGGLTSAQRALVPHLVQNWLAFSHTANTETVRQLVGRQLVLAAYGSDGSIIRATRVQAAKVLDDLYTSGANDADEQDLGVRYSSGNVEVSLWAPTATDVKLKVYNDDATRTLAATETMTRDDNTGIWSFTGAETTLDRKYYRYELTVFHYRTNSVQTYELTDPYSLSLSANGRYSQFVDLSDNDLKPSGWDAHTTPAIANPEDLVIYESHVRDFSIRDTSVPVANRGKYMAFTETESDGMTHLAALQEAGMNTFHIMPAYDYSTVNEVESERIGLSNTVAELCAKVSSAPPCSDGTANTMTIQEVFESYNPSAATDELKAQALTQSMRGVDGFNWGYDPQHYSTPEGSYATGPDGTPRIVEMRTMIKALHDLGYRAAFDVIYNHTSTSGVAQNSVLDKAVPGYYHRHNEVSGAIERSTCCENTATEHRMFHKLMVDSLLVWSQDYRIDAFRFDIMGHSPKASIQEALTDVRAVDADTYFYGEGWNIGGSEVESGRLFEQASQDNLAGTEIGTFNDRYRDFVRDASLFSTSPRGGNVDVIRLGLAGTLRTFMLESSAGAVQPGSQYSRPSYALDPADIINYVSKHDNETLWDRLQLSMPPALSNANRVRAFHISSAIPLLSQGVPFLQLAGDLMRSKSLDRNSYDAGDWFNYVDFTMMSNNWKVGLPLAEDNMAAWPGMRTVFANPNIAPTAANIARVATVFREFLEIRTDSPLFRLRTGEQIMSRVGFHNTGLRQTPSVIVMSIDDGTGQTDLDPDLDAIVVVINASDSSSEIAVRTAASFELHDVQKASTDPIVRTASFTAGANSGTFTVPAYTMAVFVKKQSGAQGTGLPPSASVVPPRYTTALKLVNSSDQAKTDLNYNPSGIYSGSLLIDAGVFTFRFKTDDGAHDLGFSDVQAGPDSLAISAAADGSISFTAANNGLYMFSLDTLGETPVLTVSLAQQIFSCAEIELPTSDDPYPFMFTGFVTSRHLYVRGNHSDWNPQPAFRMSYKGENRYQVLATFTAQASALTADSNGSLPVQFKLASDDDMWTTQLFAQAGGTGSINTAPLALGVEHAVAYGDAQLDNNSVTLQNNQKYSFLLTLTPDANPSERGPSAGNLLIQRCE